MKFIIFIILITSSLQQSTAQELVIDSLGYETFEMAEGDTTYTMKKYFIAFLKTGPNRAHTEEESAAIQAGHMAHINQMAAGKKINIAGPFGDDGDIRGILIFNVPTLEEVEKLVAQDPAVIAGRLILEVHPWWAAKGSKLE